MTGTLHLAKEIPMSTPRNQQLAVIRIGKMSHSVPAIPLKESQSTLYRKFPRMSERGLCGQRPKTSSWEKEPRLEKHSVCIEVVVSPL